MSIEVMTYVWKHHEGSHSELLVLLTLADHANNEGVCWPSVKRIAAQARVDERTVYRVLGDLETKGWVTRKSQPGTSNLYTVLTPDTTPPLTPQPGGSESDVTPSIRTVINHHLESEILDFPKPPERKRTTAEEHRANILKAVQSGNPENGMPGWVTPRYEAYYRAALLACSAPPNAGVWRKSFDQYIREGIEPKWMIEAAKKLDDAECSHPRPDSLINTARELKAKPVVRGYRAEAIAMGLLSE